MNQQDRDREQQEAIDTLARLTASKTPVFFNPIPKWLLNFIYVDRAQESEQREIIEKMVNPNHNPSQQPPRKNPIRATLNLVKIGLFLGVLCYFLWGIISVYI